MASYRSRSLLVATALAAVHCSTEEPDAMSDDDTSGGSEASASSGTSPSNPDDGASDPAETSSPDSSAGESTDGADDDDTGVTPPGTCDPLPVRGEVPPATWANVTSNLAGMSSECANLSTIAAKPCSDTVIAGVAGHGLWRTDDGGATWSAMGQGPGSAVIDNRPAMLVFDPLNPDVFWEVGIFGNGGLHRTDDGGNTFVRLGTFDFTQSVGVDFSDPARQTLLVGTHGQKQSLHRSLDGGRTWENVGLNIPPEVMASEFVVVLDAENYLVGACGYNEGICGIYRSDDAGASWAMASDLSPSHFAGPLRASDGTIYWPMFAPGGLARSTDDGVSWTALESPQQLAGATPVELPDGSIVAVGTTDLLRSEDDGTTWTVIGDPLPFNIQQNQDGNLTYSASARAFFLEHHDCGKVVLPDAIAKAGFDRP